MRTCGQHALPGLSVLLPCSIRLARALPNMHWVFRVSHTNPHKSAPPRRMTRFCRSLGTFLRAVLQRNSFSCLFPDGEPKSCTAAVRQRYRETPSPTSGFWLMKNSRRWDGCAEYGVFLISEGFYLWSTWADRILAFLCLPNCVRFNRNWCLNRRIERRAMWPANQSRPPRTVTDHLPCNGFGANCIRDLRKALRVERGNFGVESIVDSHSLLLISPEAVELCCCSLGSPP